MNKMKLSILTVASAISASSFAIDNANPFAENYSEIRNSKHEPAGVQIYSFANDPNPVIEISGDKAYLQEVNYTKSHGFAYVSEQRVTNFDRLISDYKAQKEENHKRLAAARMEGMPEDELDYSKYSFPETDVVSLLSGKSQLLLASPGGTYIPGKGWDSGTKIIQNSELGRVIVNEWHYAASGSGVIIDSDAVNHDINGHPAILIIRVAKSGRAETLLSWADAQKSYSIQVDKNINESGMRQILNDFAKKISDSYIPMKRMKY